MNNTEVQLHYTDLLLDELQKRCKKNAKYSLRSFARDLAISPSFLSRVLRRENSLTLKRAQAIAAKIVWSKFKLELFFQLVQVHHCESGQAKEFFESQLNKVIKNKKSEAYSLSQNQQSLLINWYDLAIVELTLHPDFESSPRWIGNRLSILPNQAKESIRRLLYLGVLFYEKAQLKRSHNRYWIGNYPSKSIQNFHHQHLSLASHALIKQNMNERHFMGSSFPIHSSLLPELMKRLGEFHEESLNFAEKKKPNQIYHLATQLYRLDKAELKSIQNDQKKQTFQVRRRDLTDSITKDVALHKKNQIEKTLPVNHKQILEFSK